MCVCVCVCVFGGVLVMLLPLQQLIHNSLNPSYKQWLSNHSFEAVTKHGRSFKLWLQCCQFSDFLAFNIPFYNLQRIHQLSGKTSSHFSWGESQTFLSKHALTWLCLPGLTAFLDSMREVQQHVQSTNQQPVRNMSELWMCVPNDQ